MSGTHFSEINNISLYDLNIKESKAKMKEKGERDMKHKSKILSLLLAVCLVVGLTPATVFAANDGKAIQLGAGPMAENINKVNAAAVYFGKNNQDQPGAWRVIGDGKYGVALSTGNMTLLAAGNMGEARFHNWNTEYAGSDLKTAMDALADKLTETEKSAVNERTLISGEYGDGIAGPQVDNAVF